MSETERLQWPEVIDEKYRSPIFACPNCGFRCTHHRKTIVHNTAVWFEKDGERIEDVSHEEYMLDEDIERKTKGIGKSINAFGEIDDDVETINPSSRRDAVSVVFSCESCPLLSALQIIQHKGETFIGTVVLDEFDPESKERIEENEDHELMPVEFYANDGVELVDMDIDVGKRVRQD